MTHGNDRRANRLRPDPYRGLQRNRLRLGIGFNFLART
jgi:hypothetical protein